MWVKVTINVKVKNCTCSQYKNNYVLVFVFSITLHIPTMIVHDCILYIAIPKKGKPSWKRIHKQIYYIPFSTWLHDAIIMLVNPCTNNLQYFWRRNSNVMLCCMCTCVVCALLNRESTYLILLTDIMVWYTRGCR